MSLISPVDPATATGTVKMLLDAVQTKLGMTPNMMRTMGQSPAVLEGYLNFGDALTRGRLSAQLREQIALTVAEDNGCDYCLSAHTALGKMVKLDETSILAARSGNANDAKTSAALQFARVIVDKRGNVSETDRERIREAGYTEGEIGEIIANTVLNIFTNYFNIIAETDIDFPRVTVLTR